MRSIKYVDGSGNAYTLTPGNPGKMNYDPVKPEMSSSGVYDGGESAEIQLQQKDFNEIEKMVLSAQKNESVQIENRLMGSGLLVIENEKGDEKIILQPGCTEMIQIESRLKELINR